MKISMAYQYRGRINQWLFGGSINENISSAQSAANSSAATLFSLRVAAEELKAEQ
jgi:hypothetical protein